MTSAEQFEAKFVRTRPGRTLVIGSHLYLDRPDRRLLYDEVIGVDQLAGDGVDVVLDLESDPDATELVSMHGLFAHVDCVSVLEHARRPSAMAANIERLLVPHGTLYVMVPFVHRLHSYPHDYWRFTVAGAQLLFQHVEWLAEAYAHETLSTSPKQPPTTKVGDYPYHARTDVCLFGVAA